MPRNTEEHYGAAVEDAKKAKRLVNLGFGVGASTVFYPLNVSKTLIQLGYEPFPLQQGRAWYFFGNDTRYLPNGFSYAYRMYQNFGLSAVYRGAGASIVGSFMSGTAAMYAEEYLARKWGLGDDEMLLRRGVMDARGFVRKLARGTLAKTAGIIVARPFQVIMIRTIAQHIGGENFYGGVFGSFGKIYKQEGAAGLFAGFVPQLACELCIFWTVSSASYLIDYLWKKYVEKIDEEEIEEERAEEDRLEDSPPKQMKGLIQFLVPYVANSIFYPLNLVSTVMAVNGSPLVAGGPPFIPIYPTWQDCFNGLGAKDQLKRGAKVFFRFYEKPVTYRYGAVYALPNA